MTSTKLTLNSLADLLVEAKAKGIPADAPVVIVTRDGDVERRADTVSFTQYDVMADDPKLEVFVREAPVGSPYPGLGRF